MDENNRPDISKDEAAKWLKLAIFFFVLAMCSVGSLVLTNIGAGVLLIFVGCFPVLGVCFYKLNKLGFVDRRQYRAAARPHVYSEELNGIAGKAYVLGDKARWPYY